MFQQITAQHPVTPGPLSPILNDDELKPHSSVTSTESVVNDAARMESSNNVALRSILHQSSLSSQEQIPQKIRFSSRETTIVLNEGTIKSQPSPKKRTLVVYSGPTSLDPTIGKNGVYLTNFDYFIRNGIECNGLGGVETTTPYRNEPILENNIEYVIVLTQQVADQYTANEGLITQKQQECQLSQQRSKHFNTTASIKPLIRVLTREDRCYDMESLIVVLRTYDIPHSYDHMVYMNCGLAGPKFGPGSPSRWDTLSSWTELYTNLLSEQVQMVGHTINTHFNTVYSPHIQSFLFAVNTPMIDIWLQTGSIYECGVSNDDFKDDVLRMALVWRYEVGISRVLLERGYAIAAAFMHQNGIIGTPLIIDAHSKFGRDLKAEDVIHSDVFTEDGLRRMTESSFSDYQDRRKYAILPWDCYVFFKVSRLIPYDIQNVMNYENLGPLSLVPNDARYSSIREWRRKAGVSIWNDILHLFDVSQTMYTEKLKCHGRTCKFEKVGTATGGVGLLLIAIIILCYIATFNIIVRRLNVNRISDLRRKWK